MRLSRLQIHIVPPPGNEFQHTSRAIHTASTTRGARSSSAKSVLTIRAHRTHNACDIANRAALARHTQGSIGHNASNRIGRAGRAYRRLFLRRMQSKPAVRARCALPTLGLTEAPGGAVSAISINAVRSCIACYDWRFAFDSAFYVSGFPLWTKFAI